MKVLQIGKTFPLIGGVDKVIYEISEGVSKRGIVCDVLCASINYNDILIYKNEYSKIYATQSFGIFASTWISPKMIFKLREIIKNYDIIHIHHPDPMAAVSLMLASSQRKKVVLHWHSDIVKQKYLLKLYLPIQKWLLNRANVILATSDEYGKGSRDLNNYQNKIKLLPIGVNVNYKDNHDFEQELRRRYAGKKVIYSLGRLCYYKGYEYLIDSAKYLNEDYVILIGGTGPLNEKLQSQINNNHLNNKVVLLGWISDDEMSSYYNLCDLFCLSSTEKTEAFGIVLIEAMFYNKPIVATKIHNSGVSWVNQNGVKGLNVLPENSKELAEAFVQICENEINYKSLCENSHKRYTEEFTSEKMIDSLLEIYNYL